MTTASQNKLYFAGGKTGSGRAYKVTFHFLFLLIILASSSLTASTMDARPPAVQSLNRMPLSFTKNMGQWDDRVLFRANAGGATMWFTKEGVTYQFTRRIDMRSSAVSAPGVGQNRFGFDSSGIGPADRFNNEPDSIEQLVLTAKFIDANPNPEVVGEREMEYKCNYFIGNEPMRWRTDVPNYEGITLKDIYPGIDLKYSGEGNGQAAYEFIVTQGADIAQIKVEYEGAEATSIDADGKMIVRTKWGDMTAAIKSPTDGVLFGTGNFSQLSEKTIGFEGESSSRQALGTLALVLSYSTYLGGVNYDDGLGIVVDGSGNAYVTGRTTSSNIPVLNPYQGTFQGGTIDGFVSKLSSSGSLLYSTYLGGGYSDWGLSIAVDGSGCAYVTGYTTSSNFPTLNPFQTYGGNPNFADVFVTKLSSSGNSLIYSTYLGGSGEDVAYGIAVDGSGYAYVTGYTKSTNFPTLNPYQTDQGSTDVFVTKLSIAGNSLIYSTYLGGAGSDEGHGIAVDGSGCAYVTGSASSDFPTLNPFQTGGGAFVTKYSSSGTMIYSTCLNGGSGQGIAVDGSGYAYVTGTAGSGFPTLNPYQTFQGGADVSVTKLSSSGNSLIYSTYLGGSGEDVAYGIAVDGSGYAYVTGYTKSTNFPTLNPYQTYQGSYPDFWPDVFVTKLSIAGNSLIYSTYLGGGNDDYGQGIAVDGSGNAFTTGRTSSSNFPTVNPSQSTFQGGSSDAFVTKVLAPKYVPALISPSDSAVIQDNLPTFVWSGSGDTYTLQIDTNTVFSNPITYPGISAQEFTLTDPLPNSGGYRNIHYFWRVQANYNDGQNSAYSHYFRLEIDGPHEVPSEFPDIRSAYNAFQTYSGGTVLVAPGLYSGPNNCNIGGFGEKGMNIISSQGPGATIIDCQGLYRGFYYDEWAAGSTLEGFTIRNASGTGDSAAVAIRSVGPTIRNCIIENSKGNGIYCTSGARPQIINCEITGCDSSGIFLNQDGKPTISGCTLAANHTGIGVGTSHFGSSIQISNTVISFSRIGPGISADNASVVFSLNCCDLFGNKGGDWTGTITGQLGLNNNMNSNPFFCDTASGDYRISNTSPCAPANNDCGVLIGAKGVFCNAPVANAGRDTTVSQCAPAPISIVAGCTDLDNNLSTCQLISSPGSYSGGKITFTPTGSGTYTFILKATDASGATDLDTSVATVTINSAPVVTCPASAPAQFKCANTDFVAVSGFSCTDVNGNLKPNNPTVSITPAATGASYSNGTVSFKPTSGSATYTITLRGEDVCGLSSSCNATVVVTINQPPVANAGRDSTLFQCIPAAINIPASCTDPNNNLSTCALTPSSSTGTYGGGNITFTPTGSGVYTFILKATDACGATDFDTSVVTVTINRPPVANAGRDSTLFQCTPAPISIVAGCTDPDVNPAGSLSNCQLTSSTGTYSGGKITFTPTGSGTYTFILKATDACGATDYDTLIVNVTANQPPIANAGRDTTVFQCAPAAINIPASCTDPNGNLSICALAPGSSTGTYNGSNITFTPAGSGGTYTFILKATDACGLTDLDTSVASVLGDTAKPAITKCPNNVTVFISSGLTGTVVTYPAATATDNCTNPPTITYSPNSGTFFPVGTTTVTVTATDVANNSQTCEFSVTVNKVTSVNDPPVGTSKTVTATEDADYPVLEADFGFTDPADSPADSFQSVRITALPGKGTLKLSGATVNANDEILVSAITANNLKYRAALNENGAGYTSFQFRVRDNGGTANGGIDLDVMASKMTIDVTPVNDAPEGTLKTITATEDLDYAVQVADFGFTDPNDVPPNNFMSVVITSLPTKGTLKLSGVSVTLNKEIMVGAITANNLKYRAALNENGLAYTTFQFKVRDNGGGTDLDVTARRMTINVTSVNGQPVIDLNFTGQAVNDGTSFTAISLDTCVTDDQAVSGIDWLVDGLKTKTTNRITATITGRTAAITPGASPFHGTATFVFKATDALGAFGMKSVTFTVNGPPTANAGRDTTVSQCTPAPVSIAAGCSDPDGNLSNCQLISSPGSYSGGNITFTPTVSGSYTFILKANDTSGLTDYDTSVASVTLGDTEKPTVSCPANIVKSNDPGKGGAIVTFPAATTTDNCPPAPTIMYRPTSGSLFLRGVTTVWAVAIDGSWNKDSCLFTVTVNDTTQLNISGSAGVSGASLSYGKDSTTISEAGGNYSFAVPYNWSGTVTPTKTGYAFNPASRTYTHVLSDPDASNYVARALIIGVNVLRTSPVDTVIAAGGTINLQAERTFGNDSCDIVTDGVKWSSNDTLVATVTPSGGVVTGVSIGEASIEAMTEDSAYSDAIQVIVAVALDGSGNRTQDAGEATTVKVGLLDPSSATGRLLYRVGGDTILTTIAGSLITADSSILFTIPVLTLGLRGLEYYVEISNVFDTSFTQPADNAEARPYQLRAQLPSTTPAPELAIGNTANNYRIIGFPYELELDSTRAAVFDDDFGAYDDHYWRLYHWDTRAKGNVEYRNPNSTIRRKEGYWLISRNKPHYDAGGISAVPDTTTSEGKRWAKLDLLTGWNQISTPFAFDIDWSQRQPTSVENVLWDWQKGFISADTLKPFSGYFVYATANTTLLLPYEQSTAGSAELRASKKAAQAGWEVRLALHCGEAQDAYNLIGARGEANDGYDRSDFGEPPSIGSYVSLAFPGYYPDGSERLLAGDFRSLDRETWEYDMVVRGNVDALPELVFLQIDGYTDSVYFELRDSEGKMLRTLKPGDSVRLDEPPTEGGNHYRLVVRKTSSGSSDLNSANSSLPVVTLMQNYPNPFNIGTRISFDVPELSDVSVEIKNILGQKIRSYSLPKLPQGIHSIDWDGTDQHGLSVGSGIYFYQVVAGTYTESRKMLLLK